MSIVFNPFTGNFDFVNDGDMSKSVYDPANGNRQVAFADQIVPEKIHIPKLEFAIPSQGEPYLASGAIQGNSNNTSWNFYIYTFPQHDDRFLQYQPTIELMRYKRKNKKKDRWGSKLNMKNTFVHPTHRNGHDFSGLNYGGGTQRDSGGALMPDRQTEWAFTRTGPFEKEIITFDYAEWKGSGTDLASNGGYVSLPTSFTNWKSRGSQYFHSTSSGKGNSYNTDVFAFRLRIINPNRGVEANKPFLFGDMSEPFKIYPKMGMVGGVYTCYGFKATRCNYAKNKS